MAIAATIPTSNVAPSGEANGLASSAESGFWWADELAVYARPTLRRSMSCLASSLGVYLALCVGAYFAMRVSVWLTLAGGVLASPFLLRTYIVFHDCTHGSFLPTKRANIWLGSVLGVIVYAPFHNWRHNHAMHHATAADLDRRGHGDVATLTVAEYYQRDLRGRLGYRLFRNPLVMFGLGPLFAMIIAPRIVPKTARPRMRRSVQATNAALAVLVAGLCLLIGWRAFLLIEGPAAMLAGAAGIWLFYVQHQFEGTTWERREEWSYLDAALKGSSYLKLPKVLQFCTGNIGLHHVHHLNARIPNYNLQAAHDAMPIFQAVPALTLGEALRASRLKLWDEDAKRLVTFTDAHSAFARAASATTSS